MHMHFKMIIKANVCMHKVDLAAVPCRCPLSLSQFLNSALHLHSSHPITFPLVSALCFPSSSPVPLQCLIVMLYPTFPATHFLSLSLNKDSSAE